MTMSWTIPQLFIQPIVIINLSIREDQDAYSYRTTSRETPLRSIAEGEAMTTRWMIPPHSIQPAANLSIWGNQGVYSYKMTSREAQQLEQLLVHFLFEVLVIQGMPTKALVLFQALASPRKHVKLHQLLLEQSHDPGKSPMESRTHRGYVPLLRFYTHR